MRNLIRFWSWRVGSSCLLSLALLIAVAVLAVAGFYLAAYAVRHWL